MQQVVGYWIATAHTGTSLEREVNKRIEEGWQPIGGVVAMYNSAEHHVYWYQSMVQYAEPPAWVPSADFHADQSPDFTRMMIDRLMQQPHTVMPNPAPAPITPTPSDAPGWPAPGVYGDPAGGE